MREVLALAPILVVGILLVGWRRPVWQATAADRLALGAPVNQGKASPG